jgi:hypothetical protein
MTGREMRRNQPFGTATGSIHSFWRLEITFLTDLFSFINVTRIDGVRLTPPTSSTFKLARTKQVQIVVENKPPAEIKEEIAKQEIRNEQKWERV